MKILKAKSVSTILEMAHRNSKFNTKKSHINRKWIRFLKNRKLFDEYMVYLAGHDAIGVEPKTYKQVANICHNLGRYKYEVRNSSAIIRVDWENVFQEFAEETIKWYNLKQAALYIINDGYR